MLGLVVLFVIGQYLAINAAVVWLSSRWAAGTPSACAAQNTALENCHFALDKGMDAVFQASYYSREAE